MLDHLQLADVEQMIRLLAEAGDPTIDTPLMVRKRLLFAGLAQLIDADVWDWSIRRLNSTVPGNSETISLMHGDWHELAASTRGERLAADHVTQDASQSQTKDLAQSDAVSTIDIRRELAERTWDQVGQTYFTGSSQRILISIFPYNYEIYSVIRFQRRNELPAFSERERLLTHTLFQQVDWLHRDGVEVESREAVLELSPRERQIVNLLLSGESRDSIAAQLGLSRYTINAYLRDIFRHFAVSTRAELMAWFISGQR
jgi:DNA-binding CsgD family transcriptional regulator